MAASRTLPLIVRVGLGLGLLAAAAVIFGYLALTKPKAAIVASGDEVRRVVAIDAIDAPVGRRFRAWGSARPLLSAEVPARVGAPVARRGDSYRPGRSVKAGETLLVLDDTDFRRQLDMAGEAIEGIDAQLAILEVDQRTIVDTLRLAEEELKLARADFERALAAARDGAAQDREVDRVRQSVILSERLLVAAREAESKLVPRRVALRSEKARLESMRGLAQLSLERCTIQSPIDGVLQVADRDVGEMVAPGSRVARVVNLETLEVPLLLPASARSFVNVGDRIALQADRPEAPCVDAPIVRIAPEDDPATRTFTVYVEVAASASLAPGTFVQGIVACSNGEPRTMLPRRAVSGGRVLDVTDGRVRIIGVDVEFSLTGAVAASELNDSEWVVLRERLPRGTKVVLDASRQMRAGTAVRLASPREDERSRPVNEALGRRDDGGKAELPQ